MAQPRVLIIDDEPNFRDLLAEAMEAHEFPVRTAASAKAGLALATEIEPEVVLLDQNLPDRSGLEILPDLRRLPSNPVVVIMTAYAATPSAVDAIKSGAYQYLTKPFDFGELLEVLGASRARFCRADGQEEEPGAVSLIVGSCDAIREMKRQIRRVAASPVSSVLIEGESGTGKELIAQAIHSLSDRAAEPMISVNCAALTDTLLMSELFGHEKGAFTDARERRKGVFEAAQGGTLFLDEIGAIGDRAQAALLRVLEQRRFTRVGGTHPIPVDVRVVAATNRSLKQQVADGTFREDLFFRLNVVQVRTPPLRERGADLMALAEYFSAATAARYGETTRFLAPATRAVFFSYEWPGNVRELRNAIERAYVVGTGPEIAPGDLPVEIRSQGSTAGALTFAPGDENAALLPFPEAKQAVIDRFEAAYLQALLTRNNGNVTQAAEEAGILRQALQRLLKRHKIDRTAFSQMEDDQRRAAS